MWVLNLFNGTGTSSVLGWIGVLVAAVFWCWMMVDAIRRGEYLWAVILFFFSFISALFYYFFVYRQASPGNVRGFELPGAKERKRIKELQAQIHHLDKAHLHSQLGDVYFQQGKMKQAEASYLASLERDAEDRDTRSHLGQCLARQGRWGEALPYLESVCAEEPKHEYSYTRMALAEAQAALGHIDQSIATWRQVNQEHSYTRARVQLAELLIGRQETNEARELLNEVLIEDPHTPKYQRKKDKVWIGRARALMRKLS